MTTLKEHQAAMVDLLANGSGIPASASRLAHAMHDVLSVMLEERTAGKAQKLANQLITDESNFGVNNLMLKVGATTPGLNDKALSKPTEPIKTDSPAKWPLKAEQRIKQLNNTIQQLRDSNAKLREARDDMAISYLAVSTELRQLRCAHDFEYTTGAKASHCLKCGVSEPEQAGVRKEDTETTLDEAHARHHGNQCDHLFTNDCGRGVATCVHCGATA